MNIKKMIIHMQKTKYHHGTPPYMPPSQGHIHQSIAAHRKTRKFPLQTCYQNDSTSQVLNAMQKSFSAGTGITVSLKRNDEIVPIFVSFFVDRKRKKSFPWKGIVRLLYTDRKPFYILLQTTTMKECPIPPLLFLCFCAIIIGLQSHMRP